MTPAQKPTSEDDIKSIIERHREKLGLPFSLEEPSLLFKPFKSVWLLPDRGNLKATEQELKQQILNKLHVAWDVSEQWVAEFRRESAQRPHRANEIFEEYWLHYEGLVTKYGVFKSWALEFWSDPAKPDSSQLLKGMWDELWLLCYTENIEFGVGLSILESVFAANLAIAKLSRERLKLLNLQTTPASDEPKADRPPITPGFDTYIVEKHRARLMPYLTENYTGLEPRFYAYMVGALIELEIVPPSTRHSNKSAVQRKLTQSFGANFPPQSWNAAINRLDTVHNDEDKRNVSEYARQIRAFLNPETPG